MGGSSKNESYPAQLTGHLTELTNRLRLSSSTSKCIILPNFLNRLETASRLLAHVGNGENNQEFLRLGDELKEFIDFLNQNPGRYEKELDKPLEFLTAHFESLLAEIDSGIPLSSCAANPAWKDVINRFMWVGTSLSVIGDLEDILFQWENSGQGSMISPDESAKLHKHWIALRDRMDRVFANPILSTVSNQADSCSANDPEMVYGLLLDSHFQRDQLFQKIQEGGSRVLVLDGPDQAAGMIMKFSSGFVLLADNLEPTRNLERALSDCKIRNNDRIILSVLVSGSRTTSDDLRRRVEALGAKGAWISPFNLEDLHEIVLG